jgi:hypothetical protein
VPAHKLQMREVPPRVQDVRRCHRSVKQECLSKLILFGDARGPCRVQNEIVKRRGTNCSSQSMAMNPNNAATVSRAATGSVVYSNVVAAPHDLSDHTVS